MCPIKPTLREEGMESGGSYHMQDDRAAEGTTFGSSVFLLCYV